MMNGTWYEVVGTKKVPKWARSLFVSDGGEIFIPAVLVGSEQEMFLCAGFDGTPLIRESNHLYIPLGWAEKEFPNRKLPDIRTKLEKAIR
jgi:hypothetical protein